MHKLTGRNGARRIAATAVAATAALTLAGCASTITGGGDDVSSDTTTASTAAPVTSTTPPAPASTAPPSSAAPGGDTASGTITNLPAGWKVVSGPRASIGVPAEWIDMRPLVTDPAARAQFEQNIKDSSSSAFIDSIAPGLLDTIDVMVLDGTTMSTGFTSTVNVIVDTSGLIKDLDTLEAVAPSQLNTVGGQVSAINRATVGTIETLVIDYEITTAQGITATGRQYHQVVDGAVMTATFTAAADQVDLPVWDQMAATITVNPSGA